MKLHICEMLLRQKLFCVWGLGGVLGSHPAYSTRLVAWAAIVHTCSVWGPGGVTTTAAVWWSTQSTKRHIGLWRNPAQSEVGQESGSPQLQNGQMMYGTNGFLIPLKTHFYMTSPRHSASGMHQPSSKLQDFAVVQGFLKLWWVDAVWRVVLKSLEFLGHSLELAGYSMYEQSASTGPPLEQHSCCELHRYSGICIACISMTSQNSTTATMHSSELQFYL